MGYSYTITIDVPNEQKMIQLMNSFFAQNIKITNVQAYTEKEEDEDVEV